MKQLKLVFPGGRFKALTFSYDDGVHEDRRLVSLFNQYSLKGTFHLNGGLLGSKNKISADEIAHVYAGHEVAAHTWSHPTIARTPNEGMIHEIMEDRKRLEQLVGYPVRGFSYPNGSYNDRLLELLPMLGIEYGRVVASSGQFHMPNNWYQWMPTCHHREKLQELGEQFIQLHKSQYLYLMYVWGHSYEFEQQNNWHIIEQFCELVGKRDDIWYATNIEIRDYVKRFELLQFSASGEWVYNPFAASVWLLADNELIEAKGGEITHLI